MGYLNNADCCANPTSILQAAEEKIQNIPAKIEFNKDRLFHWILDAQTCK